MIITVTMNPAIDRTVTLPAFAHGGLNRIQRIETDIGGKGINVSKTIRALGGYSVAIGLAGGRNGETIERTLQQMGIRTDLIPLNAETRYNIKIVEDNGCVTELNEPGPEVGREQTEALLRLVDAYAAEDAIFVLSGSIPRGVPVDIYAHMIDIVHAKKGKTLLDADGEAFRCALEAGPDIIKPNRAELEALYGVCGSGLTELREMGEKLLQKGIDRAVVSLGAKGALFLEKEKALYGKGLCVQTCSTVGAGDAMAAAIAYAWERTLPMEQYAALAMAASAGAVTTPGTKPPARETVDALLEQVELTPL